MRHCLILFAAALLSACYDKPVPSSDVCAIGVFAAPDGSSEQPTEERP